MNIGALIAGRYRIERLAGTGGMGSVFQARDLHRGKLVAVKLTHRTASTEYVERFSREARALAELLSEIDHPNIVEYIADGATIDGVPYLIIEWLDGRDLKKRILDGPLSESAVVRLGLQLCSALSAVHSRGIIHRDIKPTNLFLVEGEIDRVKLIDFGLVRFQNPSTMATQTGRLLGTPSFMPPEQARGDSDIDPRVDIYSMGAVLFTCLAQRPPFVGDHPMAVLAKLQLEAPPHIAELRDDISPAMDRLLVSLLAKEREERPATAEEVAEALRAIGESLTHDTDPAPGEPGSKVSAMEEGFTSIVLLGTPSEVADQPELTPVEDVLDLRPLAERYAASIRYLPAGMVLVSFTADTAPVEVATRAARFALALRDRMATIPMAMATGRSAVGERAHVGEAIDRAVELLPDSDTTLLANDVGPTLDREETIIIDEVSGRLLEGRFDIDFGMAPGGHGSTLLGETPRSTAVRNLVRAAPEYAGRKRELTMLHANFDECIYEPVSRVVLLTGAPGIGKSRLAYEFIRGLERRGDPLRILTAYGDVTTAGAPLHMAKSLLWQGLLPSEMRSSTLSYPQLLEQCQTLWPDDRSDRVAPFVGELIGAAPLTPGVVLRTARAEAPLMRDRLRDAWLQWLDAETRERPVVLVLDDLQWSDAGSLHFIHHALLELEERPLMVLALADPSVHESFPDLWSDCGLQRFSLKALSQRASKRLLRQLLGPEREDDELAQLVALSGGNPLLSQELVRHFNAGDSDPPMTIQGSIDRCLDSLSAADRTLLQAASVFGTVFWMGAVIELSGLPWAQATTSLQRLSDRDLIIRQRSSRYQGDVEYAFHHDLVRTGAYASLPRDELSELHRGAAEWLEDMGESDPVILARHLSVGAVESRAVPHLARASERALAANALDAALEWSATALAAGAVGEIRARICLVRAEVHNWRGQPEQALEYAQASLDGCAIGSTSWLHAARQYLRAAGHLGLVDGVASMQEALSAHSSGLADIDQLIALASCGSVLLRYRQLSGFEALRARLAPALDEMSPTPLLEAIQLHLDLQFHLVRGAYDRVVAGGDRVVTAWDELGYRRRACLVRRDIGLAWRALGQYDKGLHWFSQAREQARALESAFLTFRLTCDLAVTAAEGGNPARATAISKEARRESLARSSTASVHLVEARVALMEGRPAMALQHGERALAAWTTAGDDTHRRVPPERARARAVCALASLALGRAEDALQASEAAMAELSPVRHAGWDRALVALAHARTLHAVGALSRARAVVDEASMEIAERARRIEEPRWRQAFREQVTVHRGIAELARSWSEG